MVSKSKTIIIIGHRESGKGGIELMKLKEYLEWKHQKKLKGGKKHVHSKRQNKNRTNDSQRN